MSCIRCGDLLGPHSDDLYCDTCWGAYKWGFLWGTLIGTTIGVGIAAWLC